MRLRDLAVAFGLALAFLGPLAYFGELGVWTFTEPVSDLDWDEAQRAPQARGRVHTAGGGAAEEGGPEPGALPWLATSVLAAGAWGLRQTRRR